MKRLLLIGSLMLVFMQGGSTVLADSIPPTRYKMTDVTIRIERRSHCQPTAFHYEDAITLSGTGTCHVKQNDSGTKLKEEFRFDRHIVQRFLRDLYEMHFFDLRDNYTKRPKLTFDDEGGVEVSVSWTNHALVTEISLSIGSFSRMVRFDGYGLPPEELNRFVERVHGLVREHVPEFRRL